MKIEAQNFNFLMKSDQILRNHEDKNTKNLTFDEI